MDEVTASRFVSLLVKSIQSLCNQCIDFSSSIEVIGHIHLSIDRNAKFNYILTEEVSKSATEGVTIYSSRSYNSQPPPNTLQTLTNTPRQNRRKCSQVPRVDDSDSLYIKSIHTVLPDEESGSDSPSLNEPCEDCDNSSNINVPQSSDSVDINIPQNSDSVDDIKLEKHERAISQIKDKLEANVRRRKSAILTPQIQSSTTKRSRIDDNRSYSKERNMAFDGVEIKKEPSESSPYVKVETSHLAAMEDVQTPDFSSVVIESLDRVDRIEGGLNQQQQQPFPVMLHANSDIPASAVPVSPVSVPGQSIDPKSLPSSGGAFSLERSVERFFKVMEELNLEVRTSSRKLNQLLHAQEKDGGSESVAELPEGFNFPLSSPEELQRLETLLGQDEETRNRMVLHYGMIGGRDQKDCVRRVMAGIFSTILARAYNYFGMKGKKSFIALQALAKTVHESVRKQYPGATESQMREAISGWLSGSRDRDQGRREREEARRAKEVKKNVDAFEVSD